MSLAGTPLRSSRAARAYNPFGMTRTVPAGVQWALRAAAWGFWFAAMQVAFGQVRSLPFSYGLGAASALLVGPFFQRGQERKAARREGRPPRSLGALARQPVRLPLPGLDAAFAGRILGQVVFNALLLVVVGFLFGQRTLAGAPSALCLLAVHAVVRAFAGDLMGRHVPPPS